MQYYIMLYVLYLQNIWLSIFEMSLKAKAKSSYVWIINLYHTGKPIIYINFITVDSDFPTDEWRLIKSPKRFHIGIITLLLSYD